MTPSQTPPAIPQGTAPKRKLPGTTDGTPTKRAKGTLEPGFSTPNKASEAFSSPLRPATPSTAPTTPPNAQRPIGLFGSQARNIARGNQKSLTFDENDLPPDQALRLYQRIENMIKTLPGMTFEPLIALTKRLEAAEKENQKLREDFRQLEKNFESSIQELTRKMNVTLGLDNGRQTVPNASQHGSGSGGNQAQAEPADVGQQAELGK
ncbi:hypothetical protein AC578_3490 [Pseudocercospora eumusae]|uniref:Uncharacterized protein n=1 Tax=Pseudocercospora eumusae TaxID=321146 RepID=A0A139HR31_9PEZI|nr:hypothetical protein AC578_3490 [Pseudocercospora eumusae]